MIKTGTVSTNKKARYLYKFDDEIEAGIVLFGDEVKSLRLGRCDLKDSFVEVVNGQAFLVNINIPRYSMSHYSSPPKRKRKLLLHKTQLRRLEAKIAQSECTCVPLEIYFNNEGLVKVKIAIAHSKKQFEHKDRILELEEQRELGRVIKQKQYD